MAVRQASEGKKRGKGQGSTEDARGLVHGTGSTVDETNLCAASDPAEQRGLQTTEEKKKKKRETSPSGVRSRDPWTSRPADGELLVVPEAANLLIGHVIHPAGSGDVGPERRARESR